MAVLIMDIQGSQGSDNSPIDRPNVRSSPRLQALNKEKGNEKMKFKNRRKCLRLASPPPNTGRMGGGGDDSDYEPASDHEVGDAAEMNNRKRRRNQERGHASSRAAPSPVAPAVGAANEEKKRIASFRCSPSKFKEIVATLSDNLKSQVRVKNFGGLLSFKPHYLDRQLLSWLMRKLNPETMKLEIGGGKEIAITEHAVWCVFQIPNSGSDPPFMTDDEARLKRRELGVQLCGHSYNPKVGIRVSDLVDGFKKRTLTGTLGLRAFFMRNWCKAVVDNLRKAARLYKKDFAEKGIHAPITGCGIFLTMLYVDNLQHGLNTQPFALPRCAFLDTKTIESIATMDRRGDVRSGTVEFGNLRLRSLIDTCYNIPPVAPAAAAAHAAALAPQGDHGSSAPAGSSGHGAGTSHDPGGHDAINLQPPSIYQYPSFSSWFGQSVADVVGRSMKSEALKVLKAFDDNTSKAQSYMEKAVEYTSRANDLMAKAHHECFRAMQKLLADARADKIAVNDARRTRPRNDQRSAAEAQSEPAVEEAAGDGCAGVGADGLDGGKVPIQPIALEVEMDTDDNLEHHNSQPFTPPIRPGIFDDQGIGISSSLVLDDIPGDVQAPPLRLTQPRCHDFDSPSSNSTPSEEDARGAVNFNVENLDAAGKEQALPQNQREPTTADDTSRTVDVTDPTKDRDVEQALPQNQQEPIVDDTSRTVDVTDPTKDRDVEPPGDGLGDAQHQGQSTTEDTPKTDDVNKTTELQQDTQNKDAGGHSNRNVSVAYTRRSTRSSRAANVSKTEVAEARKAKNNEEAAKKMEEAKKKKHDRFEKAIKNKRANVQLKKEANERRAEHEKRLMQLREHANDDIAKLNSSVFGEAGPSAAASDPIFPEDPIDEINSQTPPVRLSQEEREQSVENFNEFQKIIFKQVGQRLKKRPRKYISAFKLPSSCPQVPLAKALALRNKIASNEKLKEMTLIDFSSFCSFDGNDLLTTFADDKDGDSSILDFTVHCIRYDDIVHKKDSIGYRVYMTTGFFFQALQVEKIYMDDGETKTEEFTVLRKCLESQIEHYSEITKAKLHYFIYCLNLIHNRIDILDSIDYFWTDIDPHNSIFAKLSIINAAFQKVTKNKFPEFDN
ncbi:uncharacterized protein C2845_PM03G23240 [Panicum miliaceum]|uniref:Uncharacterized protein n=1 Tax=Panicum miliaceum TaxID=4540 RepID=A0A3L6T3Z4_PANMI|nr:uncharacterized protein C2845_PM03G23240 [Panicum miliaceum]